MSEREILHEGLTIWEDHEKGFFVRMGYDKKSEVYGPTIKEALENFFEEFEFSGYLEESD